MNSETGASGDALQAAYRLATLSCPLQDQGCPTPDELAATARGELDPSQRERMLAILGNCARCASLVQVAAELERDAPEAPRPAPTRPPRWGWIGASAAVLLALVVIAPWRAPPPEPTRGGSAAIEPASEAVLAAAPTELRWEADDDVACRVTLRSEAADIVAQSASVSDGRFVLDAPTRTRLARGGFLWTVDCGAKRLGPFGFSVAP